MTKCVSPWYNCTGWLGIKHQRTTTTAGIHKQHEAKHTHTDCPAGIHKQHEDKDTLTVLQEYTNSMKTHTHWLSYRNTQTACRHAQKSGRKKHWLTQAGKRAGVSHHHRYNAAGIPGLDLPLLAPGVAWCVVSAVWHGEAMADVNAARTEETGKSAQVKIWWTIHDSASSIHTH